MSKTIVSRRKILKQLTTAALLPFIPEMNSASRVKDSPVSGSVVTYCLNMSTIHGQNLGFVKELEVASKAGFRSVEIWMNSLQTYLDNGGTIKGAKQRIDDLGLAVENCIGFAEWVVDDEQKREKGLEQMKKEMDLLAQIGCKRTAAPPAGATEVPGLDLNKTAKRYRTILELGDTIGVVPQLELWGSSKNLSRVSEVTYVAIESGHPSAKVLLDIFHLYKGRSPLETLCLINPSSVEILHMNDYPANLSPSVVTDADRIYPGDGVAPIKQILQLLGKRDKPLVLSVELFNKNYYAEDALTVAKTALEKTKKVVGS
jgi:sugar phosphate isomerase/epimerase